MDKSLSGLFAEVVKKHRKAKKLSQQCLADRAGISLKMLGLIERTGRNPTLKLADKLAQVLGVPLWKLIKEAQESGS